MISARDIELVKAGSFVQTVEFHQELHSTNDLALQRATNESLETPLLVLAEIQTAGRGRGGNQWWSQRGALTFSLLLDANNYEPTGAFDPRLSLVTALALRDALSEYVPSEEIQLKWPNDVFLGSRKIAGILIERSSSRPDRFVVGIGINVNNSLAEAPDEIRQRATSLHDHRGEHYPLCEVLCGILNQIARRYQMMAGNTLQLAAEWHPACLLRTCFVTVTSGDRDVTGICHGIDDQGALVIMNETGVHTLLSGVVQRVE